MRLTGEIFVNQTTGLQPYSPNKQCECKIQYKVAKSILFSIDYVAIAPQDELRVCSIDDDDESHCSVIQFDTKDIKGSRASIKFSSLLGIRFP